MFDWFSLIFTPLVDFGRPIYKKFEKPDPVQILKRREELRSDFEVHLPRKNKYGYYCDAIVRDIKRIDSFPDEATEWKEMSPYFKVAIKDLSSGHRSFYRYSSGDQKRHVWRLAFCE